VPIAQCFWRIGGACVAARTAIYSDFQTVEYVW